MDGRKRGQNAGVSSPRINRLLIALRTPVLPRAGKVHMRIDSEYRFCSVGIASLGRSSGRVRNGYSQVYVCRGCVHGKFRGRLVALCFRRTLSLAAPGGPACTRAGCFPYLSVGKTHPGMPGVPKARMPCLNQRRWNKKNYKEGKEKIFRRI
jgi:hypothetical protein